MKVALVCIAKNEDNYIQEWIDYHKKIGFDDIFIYQNNWRSSIEESNVIKIEFDGDNMQINAYNHFIVTNNLNYDWVAFFDVDEFLVLKKHKNISDFLSEYTEFQSIGINWVLFGDNGLNSVDGEYSVIKRFTKRQIGVNQHIKSIVKLNKNLTMTVHAPSCFWVDPNKNENRGVFNHNGDDSIAQINHYFTKTKDEFFEKCSRGRADTPKHITRTIKEFEPHNLNEIEDLTAYKFLYE
jgi:hypothetical protein